MTASCRWTTAVPGTTYTVTAAFSGAGDNGAELKAWLWTRRKLSYSSAVIGRIGYGSAMMVFISRAARRMRMVFNGKIFAGT